VQVINNLIINAIEAYEGREGVIDFNISGDGQMVLFEVRDSGTGMTDEVKNKLFKEMITTKRRTAPDWGCICHIPPLLDVLGGKCGLNRSMVWEHRSIS
jgi:signal transduction histidine kinase